MLEDVKRWLGRTPGPGDAVDPELRDWAQARRAELRVVPGEGFVVGGSSGTTPWRLEWGPSQRVYVPGHELRLRADVGPAASELQAMVLDRALAERMEAEIFAQYVEAVQTRADTATPPEMRWLVLFPRVAASRLGVLKDNWVALGSSRRWTEAWLEGPLTTLLAAQPPQPEAPLVLTLARGRLTLRCAVAEPEVPVLQARLRLFETALREAQRACEARADAPDTDPEAADTGLPGTPEL